MAEVEDRHWWFAARRAIVERTIEQLDLEPGSLILEPGCGTGGNFPMLARHGKLYAMELDPVALRFAAARRLAVETVSGRLPDQLPFGTMRFDLAVMCDVLEHLDDDVASLAAVRERLRAGGWLVLTVPALQWMWSAHDTAHHHRRRYDARSLRQAVTAAGFEVKFQSYFNFVLFPLIAGVRLFQRLIGPGSDGHDLNMPPPTLNAMLYRLFSSERYAIGARWPVPFGVSLIALARNGASDSASGMV